MTVRQKHKDTYLRAHSYVTDTTQAHMSDNQAVMDSANNKQHAFKVDTYFIDGFRWVPIDLSGCHGRKTVKVGIGTAYFSTSSTDGKKQLWVEPNSMYMPSCPVNLLCQDKFHYTRDNVKTGHHVDILNEKLTLRSGSVVPIVRDARTLLPLVSIQPVNKRKVQRLFDTSSSCVLPITNTQRLSDATIAYTNTHLQPLTTHNVWKTLQFPNEVSFNNTLKHNLIEGLERTKPMKSINRANRPDSWWRGKMHSKHVPHKSKVVKVQIYPGSHAYADIGEVPVKDRNGNKYYLLIRDLCTQFKSVYVFKKKSGVVNAWLDYVREQEWPANTSHLIICTLVRLTTDDDVLFVQGQIREFNRKHKIHNVTICPHLHHANPIEGCMRHTMEGATMLLYHSGLGPGSLLDALRAFAHGENFIWTATHFREQDKNKSPFVRRYNRKPHINDIFLFGCKTVVHVSNQEVPNRKKGIYDQMHSWEGFCLGATPNMNGTRVLRPLKNRVYDRYHCMYDCNTQYGDVMGAQYKRVIQMDKNQREYFNSEVSELLSVTPSDRKDVKKEESVLHMLRKFPWAPVPVPCTQPRTNKNKSANKSKRTPTDTPRARTRQQTQAQAGRVLGGENTRGISRLVSNSASSNDENESDGNSNASNDMSTNSRGKRTRNEIQDENHAGSSAGKRVRIDTTDVSNSTARVHADTTHARAHSALDGVSPQEAQRHRGARGNSIGAALRDIRARRRAMRSALDGPAQHEILAAPHRRQLPCSPVAVASALAPATPTAAAANAVATPSPRLPVAPHITPDAATATRAAPTTPTTPTLFERVRAQPNASFILEAVEHTAQFSEFLSSIDFTDADDLSYYALETAAVAENYEMWSLLQLAESTRRRIAARQEPKTRKEWKERLSQGDIESKLLREAILDELMWLVDQGKIKPTRKSNVKNLYEIGGKWVAKYKKDINSLLTRIRARWVLRGDTQRPNIDFDPDKLYSPVAAKTTVLSGCAIGVQYCLYCYEADVSKAFTVSPPDVPGLMMKAPDFLPEVVGEVHPDYLPFGADTTFEVLTCLYGLKQASARYYDCVDKAMLSDTTPHNLSSHGIGKDDDSNSSNESSNSNKSNKKVSSTHKPQWRKNGKDPCGFVKGTLVPGIDRNGEPNSIDYINFSMHVDDKFIVCGRPELAYELVDHLKKHGLELTIKPMTNMLGVNVKYDRYDGKDGKGTMTFDHDQFSIDCYNAVHKNPLLNQSRKTKVSVPMSDLEFKKEPEPEPQFNLERYKLFRRILGQVQHISLFTHPEIACAVNIVSQNMSNPSDRDLARVFTILRYLYGCATYHDPQKLTFQYHSQYFRKGWKQNPIHAKCDADLGNCKYTRRSRLGFCIYLYGMLVGWCSRRQNSVSLSTCESEYVSLSVCAQHVKWFKSLVADMGVEVAVCEPVFILTDSVSAKHLAHSDVSIINKYSKHIEHRVHWFRELVRNKEICVAHIPGDQNTSDIFTKCLSRALFARYRRELLNGDYSLIRAIPELKCSLQYTHNHSHEPYSIDHRLCCCHNHNQCTFLVLCD